MKARTLVMFFALSVLAMVIFAQSAQQRDLYTPTAPESLWKIAIEKCGATEKTAAAVVRRIQAQNPFTYESKRQFTTRYGQPGVWIFTTDQLNLTGLRKQPTQVSSNTGNPGNPPELCPDGTPKSNGVCPAAPKQAGFNWWKLLWMLIPFALIAAWLLYWRRRATTVYDKNIAETALRQADENADRANTRARLAEQRAAEAAATADRLAQQVRFHEELRNDPVTSGPPQVPGGITDERHAAQTFVAHHPQVTIVGTPRRVRVTGVIGVCYQDAPNEPRPRRLNHHRCFMANVRRNGVIAAELMMQECGNDLKFGNIMGYQVGADVVIEEGWEDTAAAPAAAEVVTSQPAVGVAAPVTEPVGDFIFAVRMVAKTNEPRMLELVGVDHTQPFSCEIHRSGRIRIRYEEPTESTAPVQLPAPAENRGTQGPADTRRDAATA